MARCTFCESDLRLWPPSCIAMQAHVFRAACKALHRPGKEKLCGSVHSAGQCEPGSEFDLECRTGPNKAAHRTACVYLGNAAEVSCPDCRVFLLLNAFLSVYKWSIGYVCELLCLMAKASGPACVDCNVQRRHESMCARATNYAVDCTQAPHTASVRRALHSTPASAKRAGETPTITWRG